MFNDYLCKIKLSDMLCKQIVAVHGLKLECVHQQYKSMKAKFSISIFSVP